MSAYAQLLNIDPAIPEKLSHFAADCISDEIQAKKAYHDELLSLLETKDARQLITTLFTNIDSILLKSTEEGKEFIYMKQRDNIYRTLFKRF